MSGEFTGRREREDESRLVERVKQDMEDFIKKYDLPDSAKEVMLEAIRASFLREEVMGAFTANGGPSLINEASDEKTYIVKCIDGEGALKRLIEYIGENGNGGHSFSIVVDPDGDTDQMKNFGWDGDGADRIISVEEK